MEIEKDKRCILYCRVSSKEQEEKGYSLESQEKLLRTYAERNGFVISKTFKISESASGKQIRKTFNEMLRYIKKRKIKMVLCEKIDRLTRNLKDGAIISDWISADPLREVHFVKENFIVNQNTKAHENLVWDMKVAIARFYTNNLSEEVKKGQKAKIEAGWIPNGQKFGYKTVGEKGHKTHIPDKTKAPYIKKAFELYNSGNYTIKRLVETLYKEGLRNKNGNKVNKSSFHRLLQDPFYCGYILWNGKEYDGKHKHIISETLFNEVQKKLKRKYKAGQLKKHFHLFKGLITCSECGCLVSWETQKGHNYGKCKGYKPCSRKSYIREEIIEKKINELLEKIKPRDKEVLSWINKALKEKNKDKKDYSQNTRESLTKELDKMENRLDRIYEDKIDELISVEYYKKKFKEYTKKKKQVLEEMGKLEKRVNNYYEIGVEIHELAFKAQEMYNSRKATTDDKRTLINRIFNEIKLNEDKSLDIKYTPAFEFLSEWMPKLNATSELLKNGSNYRKTGSLEPAHPALLVPKVSNGVFILRLTNRCGGLFVMSKIS